MGAQLPRPTDASCRAPIDAPMRAPMCSPPNRPPPQSAPCPIATHHCSRSRCVTRCPHPAQRWLWAEPRVAAVWGGGGIGHRGAGLGYGMEGDASAHCAPRCDGGCGGDAVCGAQSCSGTAQRAKGGGGGGGHQSRGDFLPLFGLIPTGAAVRGPPKHRGCSHPTERSAEQLQQCSAGGAALLPAQSRKWVPVQQKGQQSPQPSPPPPLPGCKAPFLSLQHHSRSTAHCTKGSSTSLLLCMQVGALRAWHVGAVQQSLRWMHCSHTSLLRPIPPACNACRDAAAILQLRVGLGKAGSSRKVFYSHIPASERGKGRRSSLGNLQLKNVPCSPYALTAGVRGSPTPLTPPY